MAPRKSAAPPIKEEVTTGQVAISGRDAREYGIQADTRKTSLVSARPDQEYISGGYYSWTATYLRTLPFYIDDVTRDFGDDLYERMLLDSKIQQCLNQLKLAALESGVRILPAVGKDDPRGALAQELADFCSRNLAELSRPFLQTLWNLLDALALGNKVAEQVYEVRESGPDAGKLCLKQLKVKPRRATGFVVDVYSNVVGLLGLIPGQGAPILVEGMIGQPGQVPNLLPRRKFAVLTCRITDEDIRGRSILRAAYTPWWFKQQCWGEYGKHIARFASPSVIGETAEGAQGDVVRDAAGNPVLDGNGNATPTTPEQAMLVGLQQIVNGLAMAVPHGAKVYPLEVRGEGSPFIAALQFCNDEMSSAILNQTLASGEARHQTRAASTVHQDSLGQTVASVKSLVEDCVRWDILRNLVEWNYGPEALSLLPRVSLTETEEHDFATDATAVAALETSGFLDPSQYQEIDARLGLPERSEESVKAAVQAKQAAAEAASRPQAAATGSDTAAMASFADDGGEIHWITVNGAHIPIGAEQKGGGAPAGAMRAATDADRKRLKIPPAWTDVRVSHDPEARVQAVGKDKKGKSQYKYSDAHHAQQHAAKFARIREFDKVQEGLHQRIKADLAGGGKDAEHAAVLHLQHRMAFRIGSDADTKTTHKAHGASNLTAEHVRLDGDTVHFDFIGKEGKRQEHSVHDPELARMIGERAAKGGRLFNTNDAKVRQYLKKIDGDFIPHDFRSWNATAMARTLAAAMPVPKNEKEYVKQRNEVADHVAKRLGDTRSVVLQSYIDPEVFREWDHVAPKAGKGKAEMSDTAVESRDEGEIAALPLEVLQRHAREYFDTGSYVDEPADYMKRTQADFEAMSE